MRQKENEIMVNLHLQLFAVRLYKIVNGIMVFEALFSVQV